MCYGIERKERVVCLRKGGFERLRIGEVWNNYRRRWKWMWGVVEGRNWRWGI